MPEYHLKFTDEAETEDESRERTLRELNALIAAMNGRPLAVVKLNEEQSEHWDQEGGIDYQDEYGRQIVQQVDDGETETLLIQSCDGMPLALAARDNQSGQWLGLGVDKRLRLEIATTLLNDDFEFDG